MTTYGDKVREKLSKLSNYKIATCIEICNLFDECSECPIKDGCETFTGNRIDETLADFLDREVKGE